MMTFRDYLAEAIGTFLFVFITAATVCSSYAAVAAGYPPLGLVGIAVAQGAALAVILFFTLPHSQGCLNPAVTLALWVTKRFDGARATGLVAVQLIGAAFAGGLIVAVFDLEVLLKSYGGTPHLRAFFDGESRISPGDWVLGSLTEIVLTFLLTLTLLNTALDATRPRWAPMLAGLALTAAVLAGYYLTGAALNPARWFGTAVWQTAFTSEPVLRDHLPFWMGPIVGALLAAVIHAELIKPTEKKG